MAWNNLGGTKTSTESTPATTTVAYTCHAGTIGNRKLFVHTVNTTGAMTTAPTYNGVSLTEEAGAQSLHGSICAQTWYLDEANFPGTPGSYNVVVTWLITTARGRVAVDEYEGLVQGAAEVSGEAGTNAAGTVISKALTSITANGLYLGMACDNVNTTMTDNGTGNLQSFDSLGSCVSRCSYVSLTTAGSYTLTFTSAASGSRQAGSFSIWAPAGAPSGALTASGQGEGRGRATTAGTGAVKGSGSGMARAACLVVGLSALIASGHGEARGRATVTGLGSVVASAHGEARGRSTATGAGAVKGSARGEARGVVSFAAISPISASGRGGARGVAGVTGTGSVVAAADGSARGRSGLIGSGAVRASAEGSARNRATVLGAGVVRGSGRGAARGVASTGIPVPAFAVRTTNYSAVRYEVEDKSAERYTVTDESAARYTLTNRSGPNGYRGS